MSRPLSTETRVRISRAVFRGVASSATVSEQALHAEARRAELNCHLLRHFVSFLPALRAIAFQPAVREAIRKHPSLKRPIGV
jgi:hypothetical protein